MLPKIDLPTLKTLLSPDDYDLVVGIVSTRGKNKGCLRASKPPITYTQNRRMCPILDKMRTFTDPDPEQGKTAYIWRMVAFYVSPIPAHQCMPMTADFDVPGTWSEKQDLLAHLDSIVDVIVDTIPKTQWSGVRRWAKVL